MTVLKGFDFSNPESLKKAEENNEEEVHFLRYLKRGEELTVGLLRPTEYAAVEVYDVYPLTGTVGVPQENDLFPEAMKEMFRLADELKEECGAEEARKNMTPEQYKDFKETEGAKWIAKLKEAYRFKAQTRFLFGFYDFKTGEPFVMQTTQKQAEGIFKKISNAWTSVNAGTPCQAEMFGYTLSKGTGGFSVDVDTNTMLAIMSPEDQEKHKEYRKQEITAEEFSEAHHTLSLEAQKEVIKKFAVSHPGFDTQKVIGETVINVDLDVKVDDIVGTVLDVTDEELPF